MIARPKLIHLTGVILSCRKRNARNAVDTGNVNMSNAALLASDMRVPQVMITCPGNTPTRASKRKIRMSLPRRSRLGALFDSNLTSG